MREALKNKYLDWIYRVVGGREYGKGRSYQKLFVVLYDTEFVYTIDLDGNRAEDGVDLRYRFGHEYGINADEVSESLNERPCSVLEMMAALALRCEEHIMDNPDIGDRTGQWFWGMVDSLGLQEMTDGNFDRRYVELVLKKFSDRTYRRNGAGGLFTVHHNRVDMRSVEIWYQAMWYLDEVLKN